MDFKTMTNEQLEQRKAEIAGLLDTEGVDLTALDEEVRGINAEIEARKAAEAKREEIRKAVAAGAGKTVKRMEPAAQKPGNEEVRNSKAYIDAYANYIKTGSDKE